MEYMFLTNKKKKKLWKLSDFTKVISRRFTMMERAFEIFTTDNKSYFFNVYTPKNQYLIFKALDECVSKDRLLRGSVRLIYDRKKDFEREKFMEEWKQGKLSNFDYLMLINTYASRSYNDISQYPVFPWVIEFKEDGG